MRFVLEELNEVKSHITSAMTLIMAVSLPVCVVAGGGLPVCPEAAGPGKVLHAERQS